MPDAVDDFLTGKSGDAPPPALDDTDRFLMGAPTTEKSAGGPALFDSSTWRVPQGDPEQRIRAAATRAFTNAPSLGTEPGNMSVLTPGAQDWINRNLPVVGPYVINPAGKIVGTAIGGVAAAGAAGAQTINELATQAGVNPALQRDLNIAAMTIPTVAATMPEANLLRYMNNKSPFTATPPLERPGPTYAPGVQPVAPDVVDARQRVRSALQPPDMPPPQARPTGIPGPMPPPEGYVPPVTPTVPTAVPMTSDAAKTIATAYYKTFDKAAQDGGALTSQVTDKFIKSVEDAAPKPGIVQAAAGKNTITDLAEALQPYKGKPLTLEEAQGLDRVLTNHISREYGPTGVSDIGRQIQDIQHNFRDQLSNPAPGDVIGGQAGLDALAPARKAYSQAMKMDAIERIRQKADDTLNPTTSFKNQIRTLLNNDKASRGFSDEEKDALRTAASTGVMGNLVHIMGSRLITGVGTSIGATGGWFGGGLIGSAVGATTAAATGHALNETARAIENAWAARKYNNAMAILGQSVPPHPLTPP